MPTLTSHYGFTKPTIKGDNYAWDIELNSALDAIDSEIWSATGGVNTGVNIQSSNVNITLSNPMVSTQNITMTAANMSAILPAMNAVNSPQAGSKLAFINSGSIPYNVVSNDGVTVVAAVPAGTTLVMTVNSNATSNGSFTLQNSLQSANNLADVANTANALNNILPSQSSNRGKALVSNGTSPAWTDIYPVGSLYFNATNATNPSTLLGFGTWVAFGQGRLLLGVGTGTDINSNTLTVSAGATGGEYTHALNVTEMPSHNHSINDPTHSHQYQHFYTHGGVTSQGGSSYDPGTYTDNTAASATGITINANGGGTAHNNIQPYIGVYIWQRTA